ncbi:GFA family protein [Rhodobacteraceae bacterium F11138]|nr:GFA family protein [Rhodobacteraceae bacterium F11138]
MCGAVTVTAAISEPIVRACHCAQCRRWSSSMYMSLQTEPESITVQGPVRVYRSSEWAERAFCETCGSALWYNLVSDQVRQLAAGLFDNAAGSKLAVEFFEDKTPSGYDLAGDHKRMSKADCIAMFAPKEGNDNDQL